jgi:hypothetical protein
MLISPGGTIRAYRPIVASGSVERGRATDVLVPREP